MTRTDFQVVLDACVLANFGVCDLFLRLAESPRLYLPRWSNDILAETRRTQVEKLGWPGHIADSFQSEVKRTFPESLVTGHEFIAQQCKNNAKDRHVLACAIHCQAELVVTFNLRDFPAEALSPWNVEAKHPQDYLLALYSMAPVSVLHRLEAMSRRRNQQTEDLLLELGCFVPAFARRVWENLQAGR